MSTLTPMTPITSTTIVQVIPRASRTRIGIGTDRWRTAIGTIRTCIIATDTDELSARVPRRQPRRRVQARGADLRAGVAAAEAGAVLGAGHPRRDRRLRS